MWPALLVALALPAAAEERHLLHVGNSYTFFNDLEQLTGALLAEGDPEWSEVDVRRLADGGLRFVDHVERAGEGAGGRAEWRDALVGDAASWDWVVLQEQSQIPGFPESGSDWEESLAAAAVLDGYAHAAGAETLFLMTWGRRSGDVSNPGLFPDFTTMQTRLAEGYLRYVAAISNEEHPVWVAPAGLAFAAVYDQVVAEGGDPLASDSDFAGLYVDDGSHPSAEGSYLVACVVFATITGRSPVGLESGPIDSADRREWLQEVAAGVVLGDSNDIDYPWEADEADPAGDGGGASGGAETAADGEAQCGCATGSSAWAWSGLLLVGLAFRRRGGRSGRSCVEP